MAIEVAPEQQIWVMTEAGAQLTGYNGRYLEKLANKVSKLPEDERPIKIRKAAVAMNSGCLIYCDIFTKLVTARIKINNKLISLPSPAQSAIMEPNVIL
jgi:hypothetical protein